MNRERAETHLRLLAETELRGRLARPGRGPASPAPFVTLPANLTRAAWALTAAGAMDIPTAEGILADVGLALAARRCPGPSGPARSGQIGPAWPSGPWAPRFTPRRFPGLSPRMSRVAPGAIAARTAAGRASPSAPRTASPGAADRYVPVGLMILFHDQTISGELDLMSYAQTTTGARFTAAWQARDPLGSRHHGLPPMDQFAVTDDRGARYQLWFSTKGRPDLTCDLSLNPDPPDDIRWLEITAPGETAVRINLEPEGHLLPGSDPPQVSETSQSAGEHLLNQIAELMLTVATESPQDLGLQLAPTSPGPLTELAAGLGDMVAALEAAEVLSPLSPVPGRLAALCASLRVGGEGITAALAPDLPEPWISLLAHYHRRKPDPAPPRDGFAAVAAALPELDGAGLVLLGLHNSDGCTWMNALAFGQLPSRPGPPGLAASLPLSVWIRDSSGRWHAARLADWCDDGGQYSLTLRLAPPLTRSTPWIEVLVTGQSAEVRTKLPLRWGCPP